MQYLRQPAFRPYRRIIIGKPPQLVDSDMYIIFNYIHQFIPPRNIEGLWLSMV